MLFNFMSLYLFSILGESFIICELFQVLISSDLRFNAGSNLFLKLLQLLSFISSTIKGNQTYYKTERKGPSSRCPELVPNKCFCIFETGARQGENIEGDLVSPLPLYTHIFFFSALKAAVNDVIKFMVTRPQINFLVFFQFFFLHFLGLLNKTTKLLV